MKTFITISAILLASCFNAQIEIDLTEKQALEKFKNSNVRKKLGLKISDFNYKEIIQQTNIVSNAKKLSEIVLLNTIKEKELLNHIKLINSFSNTVIGDTPLCTDCYLIMYENEKGAKEFSFRMETYKNLK